MSRTLAYSAAALLVLLAAASMAPTATAADTCNGVVVGSNFTGACTIDNCASSPTGFGIVLYVNGQPSRCIGIGIEP